MSKVLNNFGTGNLRFSGMYRVILAIYFIFTWGLFIYEGPNRLFDLESMVWISLIVITLLLFSSPRLVSQKPVLLYFMFLIFLYYLMRLPIIYFKPNLVGFGSYVSFNIKDVNKTLFYLWFSVLFSITAFIIIGKFFPDSKKKRKSQIDLPKYLTPMPVIFFSFFVLLLRLWNYLRGISRIDDIVSFSAIPVWIYEIFNVGVVIILIFLVCIDKWCYLKKQEKILTLLYIGFFVIVSILEGSRAGLYVLVLVWFRFYLCKFGDFKISKRAIGVVVLLIPLALFFYSLATNLRYKRIREFSEKEIQIEKYVTINEFAEAASEIKEDINKVSFRLSHFEHLMLIIGGKDKHDMHRFFNLKRGFRSLVNHLTPGFSVFLDEKLSMTRMHSHVFIGWSRERALRDYTSRALTPFGEYYIYFGLIGGLVAVFLVAGFIQFVFEKVPPFFNRHYLFCQILILGLLHEWLYSFGFDKLIYTAVSFLLSAVFSLGLLKFLYILKRSFLSAVYYNKQQI